MTPILVATLIGMYSWHMPFFLFALVGIRLGGVWYWYYRRCARASIPAPHEGEIAPDRRRAGRRRQGSASPFHGR
jgi:dipeptide/tripeptide permease